MVRLPTPTAIPVDVVDVSILSSLLCSYSSHHHHRPTDLLLYPPPIPIELTMKVDDGPCLDLQVVVNLAQQWEAMKKSSDGDVVLV